MYIMVNYTELNTANVRFLYYLLQTFKAKSRSSLAKFGTSFHNLIRKEIIMSKLGVLWYAVSV